MSEIFDMGKIKLELDPEQLPETVAFFEETVDTDLSTYEWASAIVDCDRDKVMPRSLFDFVVELYLDAIECGNHYAMNDLGALYYDGRGCEQDFEKSVYYYDMAAKCGDRQAQENLGYCYLYGRDVEVDYKKAFHYFALGAFDGHLTSLYKIGDMYQNGYYVEKNPEEAFFIYNRCIETMTDEAAPFVAGPVFLRLGNAFLYGKGTEKNPMSALICYQKAETFLYDMVANGDAMYKKSLQASIDGQAKAREILTEALPEKQWLDGKKD